VGTLTDLSHPLEDGMQAYPGLPSPRITALVTHEESRPRYRDQAEFLLGKVETPGNAATYIDSPFHRHRDAADLSRIPLASIAGLPGLVVDAAVDGRAPVDFECSATSLRGRAVLVRTGWDGRWGTERYWAPGPYLSRAFIDRLVRAPAALVGVDFWNADDTDDPARPAHTLLLGAGILIVENLAGLAALPREGFRFWAVPPPIVRGASFPVRAFAEIG
jgi:kynurenine formamidase